MNLLLVNDDGIESPGLWALSGAMSRNHAVTVAAPDGNCSAVGHGITLREPLLASREDYPHGVEAWAVSGTIAAALEAAMMGVKAIALSAPIGADDQQTIETFLCIFGMLDLENDFDQVLNINIPDRPIQDIKGIRWTRQGENRWQGEYTQQGVSGGRLVFYPPSRPPKYSPGKADDWNSLHEGWITLTPLRYQLEEPLEGRREVPWQ